MAGVRRTVTAHLELHAFDRADLVLSVAVAADVPTDRERLRIVQADRLVETRELRGRHGLRLHRLEVDAGPVTVDYVAEVAGDAPPVLVEELDVVDYRRPSRYAQSDTLFRWARAEFGGLTGPDLLAAVGAWVREHLTYVPGSSAPTDGAAQTLVARQGVCRDYAHLVVALLRACDMPARLVSVYAPGLDPMDFHAVVEALVDDHWYVVDATGLAPRRAMVRIATGRDAADTAFLSQHHAAVDLQRLTVTATAESIPVDDPTDLVELR